MLHIIQSNKIETLFDELLTVYQNPAENQSVFEPFNVIVPSKVMGEWLKKQVADSAGISTLVTTEFWGRYFWGLMQRVLRIYKRYRDDVLDVPDVAMLSKSIMQWQIFGLLMAYRDSIASDDNHPLQPFIEPLLAELVAGKDENDSQLDSNLDPASPWHNQSLLASSQVADTASDQSLEQRFWQLANDMASMLNRYMTYRPQWLDAWGNNQPIAIAEMIAEKDALHNRLHGRMGADALTTPDWLIEHYTQLEAAQRYLWYTLFDGDYRYRETLQRQFWQAFNDNDSQIASRCRRQLPKQLILFTVQQLPPSELLDLQRMGELTAVTLLHFNPSEQFWADIVDKNWLIEQQFANPDSIYLKDYGHTLLSRFGKQSREVFAMLANLSGNAYQTVLWEDKFVNDDRPVSLLANLQQDMLTLEEANTTTKIQDMLTLTSQAINEAIPSPREQLMALQNAGFSNNAALMTLINKLEAEQQRHQRERRLWQTRQLLDSSLSIQVCHSLVRQLEVLRTMLVGWLNYSDCPDQIPESEFERRALSDVLVLLPDIEAQQNIIEAIFPKGVGADGYDLPAKVTGVVAKDINQLWQAITGYYRLLNRAGARFSRTEVFDWLLLPPLYESFGLSLEQMSRACDLLSEAGFVRGFDEAHLQQSLHREDDDYRYSFAYALDRLVAGVLMPHASAVKFGELVNQHGEIEYIKPLSQVTLADAPLVAVLCDIYQTLDSKRHLGKQSATVADWLLEIEDLIQTKFAVFNQTNAWLAIFAAQNELKNHLAANHKKPTQAQKADSDRPNVQTDALPLKLNFILESIADQLVSQQVSAEPSGVITFARIGAVRNLPYKLVVLLNLNLSDFPSREQHNRYNLMQAGLPVRGDRFREDDDLGAFLDALLCAKQACWLFYNGKSTTDTHEHLPASPVQELLSFLQTEVQWQDSLERVDADSQPEIETNIDANIVTPQNDAALTFGQQVEQYLVTHHPALPFDKGYFELQTQDNSDSNAADTVDVADYRTQLQLAKSQLYPPARIWHSLYQQLEHREDNDQLPTQIISIWKKAQLMRWRDAWIQAKTALSAKLFIESSQQMTLANPVGEQRHIKLESVIRDMQDPAKTFIQAQQLFIPNTQVAESPLEPLQLDGLTRYQLNQLLIDSQLDASTYIANAVDISPTVRYTEVLPAGVNRYQSLAEQQRSTRFGLVKFIQDLVALADSATDKADAQSQNSPDTNIMRADILPLAQALDRQFGEIAVNTLSAIAAQDDASEFIDNAFARLGQLLTICQEQHLAVSIPLLDTVTQLATEKVQNIVITATLPTPLNSPYWLQYLPQSGKEKYHLQCWLNHLCWQVARRTTPEQVAAREGFSLWRYRDVTLYVPPLEWQQAYQYLQDWFGVWQLAEHRVMVLPPNMSLSYLQQQAAVLAEGGESLTFKQLNMKPWTDKGWDQDPQPHQYDHANWQLLLGEYKPSVIWPFLTSLVPLLYQPLYEGLMDVYAEPVAVKPKKAASKIKLDTPAKATTTAKKPRKTSKTTDS